MLDWRISGNALGCYLERIHVNIAMAGGTIEMDTATKSGIPEMVFVDVEGLEEQLLTEDEVSQEVADITAN